MAGLSPHSPHRLTNFDVVDWANILILCEQPRIALAHDAQHCDHRCEHFGPLDPQNEEVLNGWTRPLPSLNLVVPVARGILSRKFRTLPVHMVLDTDLVTWLCIVVLFLAGTLAERALFCFRRQPDDIFGRARKWMLGDGSSFCS
jgi:hypothetical protein